MVAKKAGKSRDVTKKPVARKSIPKPKVKATAEKRAVPRNAKPHLSAVEGRAADLLEQSSGGKLPVTSSVGEVLGEVLCTLPNTSSLYRRFSKMVDSFFEALFDDSPKRVKTKIVAVALKHGATHELVKVHRKELVEYLSVTWSGNVVTVIKGNRDRYLPPKERVFPDRDAARSYAEATIRKGESRGLKYRVELNAKVHR